MVDILAVSPRIQKILVKHSLQKQFEKQLKLLAQNPKYPSLHVELLEPKRHGIYSFRIDRKYRVLFFFRPDKQAIEILAVTVHYG